MPIDSVEANSIVSYIESQHKAAHDAGKVKISQLLNILKKVDNTSVEFSFPQVLDITAALDGCDYIIKNQGSKKKSEKLDATNRICVRVYKNTSASTLQELKQWPEKYKSALQANVAILTAMRPALAQLCRRDPCEAISQMDVDLMDAVLRDSGVLEVVTNDGGRVVQSDRQYKFEHLMRKLREGPETKPIFYEAFAAWEATLASATPQNAS